MSSFERQNGNHVFKFEPVILRISISMVPLSEVGKPLAACNALDNEEQTVGDQTDTSLIVVS